MSRDKRIVVVTKWVAAFAKVRYIITADQRGAMSENTLSTRMYVYSGKFLIPTYTASFVGFFGLLLIALFFLGYFPAHKQVVSWSEFPTYTKSILLLTWLVPVAAFCFTYARARPLSLNDDRVSAYLFGKVWKSIAWPDVTKIEKHEYYDAFFSRNRTLFIICDSRNRITFDDGMKELSQLLLNLNRYIAEFHIPLIFVERGRDGNGRRKAIKTSEIQRLV